VSGPGPTIRDIQEAAVRIRPHVWHTPLQPSRWLSSLTGAKVWLKLENVQATGSFKIRGAFNALLRLRESRPDVTSVTTASAGNHGLALTTAAAALGLKVRVHLPSTAPAAKRSVMQELGADIVEAPTYDQAEDNARADVARSGAIFVSAYSHTDVIAGAGTAALEMIADEPSLDTFLVPLGGGGLLAGTALVAKSRVQDPLVLGAEASASPVFTGALAAGHPVTVPVAPTIADGLAGNMEPDSQTFGLVRDLVDRVIAVQESAIVQALQEIASRERLIVEGASATAVGALLAGAVRLKDRRVGIILSGRNIDWTVFRAHA